MKNLFICHTQAHLISASGLALGRFKDDENDLILFVDFGIKDELKERLDKTFTRTLYLQSIYPAEMNTAKAKLKWYPQDWKLIKQFLTEPVDRAFAVCDWLLLVQKTLQRCYKLNKVTVMAWLEDGVSACCSASDIHNGMDKCSFTMAIRRFLFRDLIGIGQFYERDFNEMGGLRVFREVYTCYPDAIREPYRSHRQIVGISDDEYLAGLSSMYPKSKHDVQPNSVILVVDKLDRYAFPDKVRASLSFFINKSKEEGKTVICKFHPRETEVWDIFDGCSTMDKSVGIESAYVSLADIKDSITIAGVKSAGLMSAKKLGYNTVSLFPSCGEQNENLVKFYDKLGIKLI